MPKKKGIEKKNSPKIIRIRPVITIVCDDVRMENNSKPFVIGIYLGGINISGIKPANPDDISNLSIFLWIPCEVTELGTAAFEIKIISPNPKHQLHFKGKVDIDTIPQPTELVPLIFGPIPLKLWQDGDLKILFKHEDETDYQTLRVIPVKFNTIDAPIIAPHISTTVIEPIT